MNDAYSGSPTYLVNHLLWAADGSQAVEHGMPEAVHDTAITIALL